MWRLRAQVRRKEGTMEGRKEVRKKEKRMKRTK
jgi:hypothetical protein